MKKIWSAIVHWWSQYVRCPRPIRPVWEVFKASIRYFQEDKVHRAGAALAYYTIFSLPAILVIVIGLVGFFLGEAAVRGEIYSYLEKNLFHDNKAVAQQIENAVRSIGTTRQNWWATVLGLGFLIFIATNIFYAMQETLNRIFQVEQVPQKVAILKVLINRVLSFAVVMAIGGLVVLSILLNTVVFEITNWVATDGEQFIHGLPDQFDPVIPYLQYFSDYFVSFLNLSVSIIVLNIFFILLYKILPAVQLRWNYVFWASFWVSLFFFVGQIIMSYYLSHVSAISAYGAAGSLIILLIWVYYSAQLFFWGAEFTRAMYAYKCETIKHKAFTRKLHSFAPKPKFVTRR